MESSNHEVVGERIQKQSICAMERDPVRVDPLANQALNEFRFGKSGPGTGSHEINLAFASQKSRLSASNDYEPDPTQRVIQGLKG